MKALAIVAGLGALLLSLQPVAQAQEAVCDAAARSKAHNDFVDALIGEKEIVRIVRESKPDRA